MKTPGPTPFEIRNRERQQAWQVEARRLAREREGVAGTVSGKFRATVLRGGLPGQHR